MSEGERQKFEAWAAVIASNSNTSVRDRHGCYLDPEIEWAWQGYKLGRAEQPSSPSLVKLRQDLSIAEENHALWIQCETAAIRLLLVEQPSQTRAAEGWISVLDRLPNVEDKLLVLDDAAYVHMAYHRPDSETYRFDCDTYGLKVSDVTHWMYVPEPPNAAAVPVEDRPAPTPQTWKQKVEPMEIEAGVTEDKEKP